MIGSNVESGLILSEMKKLRLNKINTIIAYDFQLNSIDNLLEICNEFDVDNIYLPYNFNYSDIKTRFNNVRLFATNVVVGNLQFNSIVYKDQVIGVTLNIDNLGTILIPEVKPTKLESKYLLENYANVDFIYVNSDNINIDFETLNAKFIISNENCALGDIELEKIDKYILNEHTMGENSYEIWRIKEKSNDKH